MDIAKKYKSAFAALLLAVVSIWFFYENQQTNVVQQSLDIKPEYAVETTDPVPTTENLSSDGVPESFPAPAKKLHQIISDIDISIDVDDSLEAKIDQLNQKLDVIDTQLPATSSELSKTSSQQDSMELEARLSNIQAHLPVSTQ